MKASIATPVAGHIAVIDGKPTTTTQDIAEVYGKQHAKVLAIVRQRMAEVPADWCLANFGEASIEVKQPNGGTASYPVIRMTKKGFHFVVGKFTGAKAVAHQIAFADEFERMERELTGTAPQLALATLAPAQAHAIKSAVEAKCKGDSKAYSACYHALYDAFRVPSYKDLPASRFDAALAFVQSWAFDPPALPATNPQAANLPAPPGTAVLVNRTNLAALINLGKLLHDLTYQQGLHSALSAMGSPLSARLSGITTEFQFTSALLAHHLNNH